MAVNPDSADKRGYLEEPFRLFRLKGVERAEIPYHYHEFHKLILFLSGGLTYLVEGRGYQMRPGEMLLVPAHAIHQPVISPSAPYARTILWIQPQALEEQGLGVCFARCRAQNAYLLGRDRYDREKLQGLLSALEESARGEQFGDEALSRALFVELMVAVNRAVLSSEPEQRERAARQDPKIDEILDYINANLAQDLSVDALSERFYLSRSWLMHRFKDITGCPVHQYVLQKRLICAAQLLRRGESVGEAVRLSGFADYSAFLRAFRRAYGVSPREYR
ncbi:MAG: helix-turn-helix domain-containing protein [Oscillospiraceae bacterium]|nr:helix-turn-helix domain-containing protein [Oscillospiraceae bacterium]